jgi:hypothetical protein
MNQNQYHLSLYILVPFIFTGISPLSAAGADWITLSLTQMGTDAAWPLRLWAAGMGTVTLLCGLVVAWLILKPIEKFIQETESLSILPKSQVRPAGQMPADEIKRFTEVVPLNVPPLRNRKEDILLLAEFILDNSSNPVNLSRAANELLLAQSWPAMSGSSKFPGKGCRDGRR